MGSAQQPFLYGAEKYGDDRFPPTTFDPKAVTRASFQSARPKPKTNGPLIAMTMNRHPDAHEILVQRSVYWKPMSNRTKWWIKAMRVVQLVLRVLELLGATGILVLMVLLNRIDVLTVWVMRITPGIVMIHCVYAIYHLSRGAGGRTPGTSAAYHTFAGFSDLCILPIYAYGLMAVRNSGADWGTILSNQDPLKIFIPTVYYTLIGAAGLHLASLAISLWLGIMFRRIQTMPPDMNPLESNLTSRHHKRNKSSVVTTSDTRLSTPLEDRRRSGLPYEALDRPPTVPFLHTRMGSEISLRTRDSRIDLPSRQYQITPRNSAGSGELRAMSATPPPPRHRTGYAGVPLHDISRPSSAGRPGSSRPGTANSRYQSSIASSLPPKPPHHAPASAERAAKFTEAWYASESLINRTQARNQQTMLEKAAARRKETSERQGAYEAVSQRKYYDEDADLSVSDLSDEGGGDENAAVHHPNPLRSHPASQGLAPRPKTPYAAKKTAYDGGEMVLAEIDLNDRRVSGSVDIADEKPAQELDQGKKRRERYRNSSIQPESAFYSKPYGELKAATPPLMVGGDRQLSSGNDYDVASGFGGRFSFFRGRNVSGKVAEEGRGAGSKFDEIEE